MKKKYWIELAVFVIIGLLFIYKEYLYIPEKVYVVYQKSDVFYKNKYHDIFYYKKNGRVLELSSFKDKKKIQKDYQKIKKLNVITVDSLSRLLPFSYFDTYDWGKEKLDRLKKLKVFIIEVDSLRKSISIKEVYQPFSES